MKITDIKQAVRNPDRVNVSVDGKYRFSLDIYQVSELGVKIGREYSEEELASLETESQFGKLYARALEYTLLRPHSSREVRDYLYRKTLSKKYLKKAPPKKGLTFSGGEKSANRIVEVAGASPENAERVFNRLVERGHIDDEKFARWWVENRNLRKGSSRRKLASELAAKGVPAAVAEAALAQTERSDQDELAKIVAKKRARYPDEKKLIAYLARQGFGYDDIKTALADSD